MNDPANERIRESGWASPPGNLLIAAYRAARLGRTGPVPPATADGMATRPLSVLSLATEAIQTCGADAVTDRIGAEPHPQADSVPPPSRPVGTTTSSWTTLAEIGVGPSMSIRLSQIGFCCVDDLALTDAADLRAALGESSRLLNLEGLIARARKAVTGV